VGVVIVNWNKKDYVLSLLNSLQRIHYGNYEITVVDNASTDRSVDSIRQRFPNVNVIANSRNIGGPGGFNAGMKYLFDKGRYKYIWLLDNDAGIEKDTLLELVNAMEGEDNVGIMGSMLLEPDGDYIVELGAFVSWPIGTWVPNLRNKRASELGEDELVEVDYVASCSALVRVEVLEKIGFMDERFFLHWDDIDFSLRAKKAGYKVKATAKSKTYHGIEGKSYNPLLSYYDIRNGLLAISKHQKGLFRFIYILNMLRGSSKGIVYSFLAGLHSINRFMLKAILDFVKGDFYQTTLPSAIDNPSNGDVRDLALGDLNLSDGDKILVFPNGGFSVIKTLIEGIGPKADCSISLLIQSDRKELFGDLPIDDFITFEGYKQSTLQTLSVFWKIFSAKYDLCISPTPVSLPFSYAACKYYLYDEKKDVFLKSREVLSSCWKLPLAFLGGELLAFCLAPIVFLASFRENK